MPQAIIPKNLVIFVNYKIRSMEAFLSFIFWCILIFYVAGIAGRWLLRRWLRNKARQFEQAAAGNHAVPGEGRRREGEVTVERIDPRQKHVNSKVGEYVEYEEVKE